MRLDTRKANKKLNMDISADAAGRTGGVQEKTATRSADARDQWTWLDTKKANEKIEYGHKCGGAARAKSEAVGRQALAERAASEAKFVLIAERKKQEEA